MAEGLKPRLRITASTGATMTASLAGDSVEFTEVESGVYEADVDKLGPWAVTGTLNGDTSSATVEVTDVARVTGELSFISTVFDENDLETISAVGAAGTGANYWSIGDTYPVTLNGTIGTTAYNKTMYAFIAHFNYKGQNGIYLMGFKDKSTGNVLGLCDNKYNNNAGTSGEKKFSMNHQRGTASEYGHNYGGWKGCDLRYDILGSTNVQPSSYTTGSTQIAVGRVGYDPQNYDIVNSPVANTFAAALPLAWRKAIKPFTVYTDNVGNSSTAAANVTASTDYFVLPAEYEVSGNPSSFYANTNEVAQQEQLKYYELGNSKVTYKDSDPATAVYRWERSPNRYGASAFARVHTDGSRDTNYSRDSSALTPLWRVA